MLTSWEVLEEVFKEMGIDYARQGSYRDGDTLPDSFFTFWNINSNYGEEYDNLPHQLIEEWGISFYSNNPQNIYTTSEEFIKKARDKGFVIEGGAYDTNSDLHNYYGRYIRIKYSLKKEF